jgi:hypothetical protein
MVKRNLESSTTATKTESNTVYPDDVVFKAIRVFLNGRKATKANIVKFIDSNRNLVLQVLGSDSEDLVFDHYQAGRLYEKSMNQNARRRSELIQLREKVKQIAVPVSQFQVVSTSVPIASNVTPASTDVLPFWSSGLDWKFKANFNGWV